MLITPSLQLAMVDSTASAALNCSRSSLRHPRRPLLVTRRLAAGVPSLRKGSSLPVSPWKRRHTRGPWQRPRSVAGLPSVLDGMPLRRSTLSRGDRTPTMPGTVTTVLKESTTKTSPTRPESTTLYARFTSLVLRTGVIIIFTGLAIYSR